MAKQKCPICNKEYQDGRSLHGHLMRIHEEEYRAAAFDKKKLKPAAAPAAAEKPAGFRLLNKYDPDELEAYKAGYRFIDGDDNIYTAEEVKEESWI